MPGETIPAVAAMTNTKGDVVMCSTMHRVVRSRLSGYNGMEAYTYMFLALSLIRSSPPFPTGRGGGMRVTNLVARACDALAVFGGASAAEYYSSLCSSRGDRRDQSIRVCVVKHVGTIISVDVMTSFTDARGAKSMHG